MRNHGQLLTKITAAGLMPLLLLAGVPPTAAAGSCKDWKTAKFFETATVDEVRACLSAGRDPNEVDRQGLTALHRAARETSDPAVIEALLDAGANPRLSSRAGRLPRYYARKNDKIKGSAAYQRLRIASAKKPKKADWSRVRAVPHHRKTKVLLYRLFRDAASRKNQKIKGRFHSASADSITLVLENGQTRTVDKQAVRKVLIPRPFKKRWPGWVALGVGAALVEILLARPGSDVVMPRLGHAFFTLPTAAAFFYGSRMKGIYYVPPKHRMLPQADKQPGDQGNASGKQEEPGSPTG